MGKIFCVNIPIRLESEANKHDHYMVRHKRLKPQVQAVKFSLITCGIKPPCRVKLTRVAPRSLDAMDNLPACFKHVIDAVASFMHPGLKPGRADDCRDIKWELEQVKGDPKTYALRIEIEQL